MIRSIPMAGLVAFTLGVCSSHAFAQSAESREPDAAARRAIFGEEFLDENVAAIRARASVMPPEKRYAFLLRRVLTRSNRLRLSGRFTPTDPAPVLQLPGENEGIRGTDGTRRTGGTIVSPVYDLLDLAKALNRLAELRDHVVAMPKANDEPQQRAHEALRLLVHLELGNREAAERAADRLLALVLESSPTSIGTMWPETLVVHHCIKRRREWSLVSEILSVMHSRRTLQTRLPGMRVWHAHITGLVFRQRYLAGVSASQTSSLPTNWVSTYRSLANTRGEGFPQPEWVRSGDQLQHITGHNLDTLMYRSPLRGNFAIEADLGGAGHTQFLAAGRILGLRADGRGLDSGTVQRGTQVLPLDPPMGVWDPWIRYRGVFRNGTFTAFLDGRAIYRAKLSDNSDPWIGIQSMGRHFARVRDIRIIGNPEVPESVVLSDSPELTGWMAYHHDRIAGEGTGFWFEKDAEGVGQIVARRHAGLPAASAESLLRYQRPLFEDGSVEYEFFYEPGRTQADPAVDRLAFLMRPDGVHLHWITDGPFDRTGLAPSNISTEGPKRADPLPFRPDEWNHAKLILIGGTVQLELNGELIDERPLSKNVGRTFGLFRYRDKAMRVRNVVMRGDWPKTVPPVSRQEMADPRIAEFDARLGHFEPVFHHEFASAGLPPRYFTPDARRRPPRIASFGLLHRDRSNDGQTSHSLMKPMFQLVGDFDVTLQFADFQTTQLLSGCGVAAYIEGGPHLTILRRKREPRVQRVYVNFATPDAEGGFVVAGHYLPTATAAGSFRLVRRGDTYTALYAEHDSNSFRVIGEHTWKGSGQKPVTLDMRAFATPTGETSVIWKRVRFAADQLMLLPDPAERRTGVVFVMNADGSELRQLTQDMAPYISHGSPDWSPDGKRVAFDGWTGRATTSHVFVINDDGTRLDDLGVGIMPTFSPDGKRLAFTWAGRGMAIMNVDGTEREVVANEGWGAQWSSNGRWISYSTVDGGGANVAIVDLETRDRRLLLEGAHARRYSRINHNMEWSIDADRIVFLGHLRNGGSEVTIISVDGSSKHFEVITTEPVAPDFCWHPKGDRIMISKGGKLFYYEFATKKILLLPGQPMDQTNAAGVWDADGSRVVFSGVPKPAPKPWRPDE